MKKRLARWLATGLALVLSFTALACDKNGETDKTGKPAGSSEKKNDEKNDEKIDVLNQDEKITIDVAVLTGFTQSDSMVQKTLEEKYNVDFNLVVLPGWADAQAKITLMMTDPDQRPDVIWWWAMDNEYLKWVDAGLLVDVAPYMEKYTNMVDYYNEQDPKTMFYAAADDGKIYRIPGDVSEPSCEVTWIRKDWLDNLGLEVPETIEDLMSVMQAFTEDDPDGNGKNDTYGLGGDGYDFRTFWPFIQGVDETHYNEFVINKDGKVIYGPASDTTKVWLGQLAEAYDKGWITPNITQDTNRDEEFASSNFGITYSWVAWNNPGAAPMEANKKTHPEAEWIPIDMVKGSNGNPQEEPATSAAWAYFGITDAAENPERIYAIWDDFSSHDNYIFRRFGREGKEYTIDDDGNYQAIIGPEGQENKDENIGLMLFDNLFNRKDSANLMNTKETYDLFVKCGDNSRDRAKTHVEWKDRSAFTEWVENGTDIGDAKNEYFWGVIAGSNSLDDWDAFIERINGLGLPAAEEQANDLYAKQKVALDEFLDN